MTLATSIAEHMNQKKMQTTCTTAKSQPRAATHTLGVCKPYIHFQWEVATSLLAKKKEGTMAGKLLHHQHILPGNFSALNMEKEKIILAPQLFH